MRWSFSVFSFCFLSLISCFVNAGITLGGAPPGVAPALQLNWFVPSQRENGSNLPLAQIGGYELRYRIKGTSKFKSVVVRGASNKSYLVRGLPLGIYEFQIATFDADGLYSVFAPINYKLIK